MTDPIRDRYDCAYRTLQALNRVSGLLDGQFGLRFEPQPDHASIWVIQFDRTTLTGGEFSRHISISETNGRVTIELIERPSQHADGLVVALWSEDQPALHSLATMIVDLITGKTTIPPESRRVVRDTLHNAPNDARFHYRIGLDHILSNTEGFASWGTLDEADKWAFILDSYAQASNTPSRFIGHLATWRALGVPMQVMDIYDDAYHQEAATLIGGITGGAS